MGRGGSVLPAAAAAEFDMKCYIYEAGRGGARGVRAGWAPPLGSYNRRPWQVAPGAERGGRRRRIDGPIFIRPD